MGTTPFDTIMAGADFTGMSGNIGTFYGSLAAVGIVVFLGKMIYGALKR